MEIGLVSEEIFPTMFIFSHVGHLIAKTKSMMKKKVTWP